MKNTHTAAEDFIKRHTEFPHQPTFAEAADLMVKYADLVAKPLASKLAKRGPRQVDPVNIDREIGKHVGR